MELLVSPALALIVAIMAGITHQTSQTWRYTVAKTEQFQRARDGFESMTRRLSQATLNTYWDYDFPKLGNGQPDRSQPPVAYVRQSELRFRSGLMSKLAPDGGEYRPTHGVFFQAPMGLVEDAQKFGDLNDLLNTWGYFLEVSSDEEWVPPFLKTVVPPRVRSRLMEFSQPSEKMSVYQLLATDRSTDWFSQALERRPRPVRVVAENVVALVLLPRLARPDELDREKRGKSPWLVKDFDYDSTASDNDPEINPRNQLPPVVQVTMVAVDEISASRLEERHSGEANLGLEMGALFRNAALLEDDPGTTDAGDGDLAALEEKLIAEKLTYRVFTTSVSLRGAKWSKATVNQ